MTGYPSVDKPWLKYFPDEVIDVEIPERSLYDCIRENNKDNLENGAISYYDKIITYRELFQSIDIVARSFVSLGIKAGDYVAICSVTIPEVIYSIYALNKIGAVCNMIDPRTNTERIKKYIDDSHTKCILAIDKCLPKIEMLCDLGFGGKVISLTAQASLSTMMKLGYVIKNKPVKRFDGVMSWKSFLKLANSGCEPELFHGGCNAAAVVYTGGTTGVAKGAILSNNTFNIISAQFTQSGAITYDRSQYCLNIMPPFIAYGLIIGIHMPLSVGMCQVVIPMFNPDEFATLLNKYRPAHTTGVPSHYEGLFNSKELENVDFSFIESAGVGGDSFSLSSEKEINSFFKKHNAKYPVAKGYGMTEVGSAAAACLGNINKPGSVGIPLYRTIISVFKFGTDEEMRYGEEGEICICTPAVMLGYLANEKETSNIIRKHSDGKTWVHSGDIGFMDEDGFIFIRGRIKRMIIRPDGHNVFPAVIENVIMEHKSVKMCAVVGKPDSSGESGKWPVAFIELREASAEKQQILHEIENLCEEKLPLRDSASEFRIVDHIPLTDIGKTDYKSLEKILALPCSRTAQNSLKRK